MTPADTETPIDTTPESSEALDLRRPDVPATLAELAARKGEALEILEARVTILATLNKAALRTIHPTDLLLFKSPEEHGGQVTAYVQDSGCERVRDLYGIEIFNVSVPEKVLTNDPKVFHYIIRGDGRCKFTRQTIEAIEGGRSSTDDFCKDKAGAELELSVRKAARANLDGRIVRELAGLSSVPIEAIKEAWTGTAKRIEDCRRGRGFGTHSERLGGRSEKAPDVDPPVCPHCKSIGVYRPGKGDRGAFYGCPKWDTHKDQKFIVNAETWARDHARPAPPAVGATGEPAGSVASPAPASPPLTADDIFK